MNKNGIGINAGLSDESCNLPFLQACTIDEDGIMTCHAGSGSELNISEEVFEFRLRDMESLNWMMRKARLEGRKIRPASLDERYFDNLLNYKRFQY